ncbi:uncharacterized protein LOC119689722 [Teleopsis dalmanni]|uniref:uncharacterized protein LOC119689722 n=2 Tax=Teleopsis dalmanni TaxID=139649 RepID=UPI0018CE84F8|nr:uncharacterized protein LOC119689722 [Teleopsis dalmanni]
MMENSEDNSARGSGNEPSTDTEEIVDEGWLYHKTIAHRLEMAALKAESDNLVKVMHQNCIEPAKKMIDKEVEIYTSSIDEKVEFFEQVNNVSMELSETLSKLGGLILEKWESRIQYNQMFMTYNKKTCNKVPTHGGFLQVCKNHSESNKFFRDLYGRPAPDNADYIQRKKEGEIFPMDFKLIRNPNWTENAKKPVVFGVKEQLIMTLINKNVMNIKMYAGRNKNTMLIDLPRHMILKWINSVETKQSRKLKYQSSEEEKEEKEEEKEHYKMCEIFRAMKLDHEKPCSKTPEKTATNKPPKSLEILPYSLDMPCTSASIKNSAFQEVAIEMEKEFDRESDYMDSD